MADEVKAEAIEEVAQASTPESRVEQPKPTMEELMAQVTKLTSDYEKAKKEASSAQKFVTDAQMELGKRKGVDLEVSKVRASQELQAEILADILNRLEDREEEPIEEQPPKRRKSEEYLARLKNQPQVDTAKQREQEYNEAAVEADGLVKSLGLTMDKSPETEVAYLLFRTGDYKAGLERIKRLVESKQTPIVAETKPKESETERIERLAAEMSRKDMETKGLLTTDISRPAGGGGKTWTMAEIQAMPTSEYSRNFPLGFTDVYQGIQEGRIK